VNGGGKDTPPETWNARFSFAPPRDPFAVPEARAPRIRALWGEPTPKMSDAHAPVAAEPPTALDARVCHSPFGLARRFEALRRVLENPRPHVERLARVLARAVRRFPEIVRKFVLAPARTNDYDPDDPRLAIEAIARALDAPDAFRDSS
jgi:hypothetical protein